MPYCVQEIVLVICKENKKASMDMTNISTRLDDIDGNVRFQFEEIEELMCMLGNVERNQRRAHEECM